MFAYTHFLAANKFEEKYKGWQIYNIENEFQRLRLDVAKDLDSKDKLFRYVDNTNGNICSTYPDKIV